MCSTAPEWCCSTCLQAAGPSGELPGYTRHLDCSLYCNAALTVANLLGMCLWLCLVFYKLVSLLCMLCLSVWSPKCRRLP